MENGISYVMFIDNVMFQNVENALIGSQLDTNKFPYREAYEETLTLIAHMSPSELHTYASEHQDVFQIWDKKKRYDEMKKLCFRKYTYSKTNLDIFIKMREEDFPEPKEMYRDLQAGLRNLLVETKLRKSIRLLYVLRLLFHMSCYENDGGKEFIDRLALDWEQRCMMENVVQPSRTRENENADPAQPRPIPESDPGHLAAIAGLDANSFSDYLIQNPPNSELPFYEDTYEEFILSTYLSTTDVIDMLKGNEYLLNAYIEDINKNTPYDISIMDFSTALNLVNEAISTKLLVPNEEGLVTVYNADGSMQLMSKPDIIESIRYDSEGADFFRRELEKRANYRLFDTYVDMHTIHCDEVQALIAAYNGNIKQLESSQEYKKLKTKHDEEKRIFEQDYEHLCEEFIYIMANHEYPQSGDLMLVLSDAGKTIDDIKNDERIRAAFNEACTHRLHLIV